MKIVELHVHMDFERGGKFSCSKCECEKLPVHDTSPKTWRHLNFFQHKCFIHLRTPRTNCNDCGVTLWTPPWVRLNSGFTLLFEAFVLTLAKSMPMTKISQLVDEHDTRLWRIINHHVGIAKAKKDYSTVELVGCDETSRKKGHNYVTVFADMTSKEVLFATKGKDSATIKRFSSVLEQHNAIATQLKEITIDMSPAFIRGTADYLPNANITFDKFHVIQALNKVQDEVRRTEQRENPLLKKSRYL